MTKPRKKRKLETIAPEWILDSIKTTIKNLSTWPFKEAIFSYLKKDVSAWLKEATLKILDSTEEKVVELIGKSGMKYIEFRESLETDWDSYVDAVLYRIGFTSVPQGDGYATVEFTSIPLEDGEQKAESVVITVLVQFVVPILIELIGSFFAKK